MDYPDTDRREVVETIHGEEVLDPYRWLEEDTEAVREWVEMQNDLARRELEALDAYQHLRPRFEDLAKTVEYEPVVTRPGERFQRVRAPKQNHSVLYHWTHGGDERRPLVDPNDLGDPATSVDWFVPDHDGSLVVYGVAAGGNEQYDLHVLDVETGTVVDRVPDAGRPGPRMIAWTDDGFYYIRTGPPAAGEQLSRELRYHELGAEPAEEPVLADGFSPQTWPLLETAADTQHLVVACEEGWDRTDLHYLRHGEESLKPLLVGEDAVFDPTMRGERLYLRTSLDAPYYRIASLDLADRDGEASPATLEPIVPERDAMLRTISLAERTIIGHYERVAVAEVEVFTTNGDHVRSISMPGMGTVDGLDTERRGETVRFRYQSFDCPPTTYRDDGSGDLIECDTPEVRLPALTVEQKWYESTDGTDIPLFVVHRAGQDPEQAPTVLRGYGGFEVSRTPTFDRFVVPFLADGGVLALANLRGGGELGEAWHHAGRRETKQRTFDDFIAAAHYLIDCGYTTRDRLGIDGGSNGGLTVGAALTQRPDLFAACLCRVPLLDMLRFHTSLLGESWTTEYGSPANPDEFTYLHEYSPYHNLGEDEYPGVLLTTGEGDTRVDPFHARKMTARLQTLTTGDSPILLRTRDATGHGMGKPITQQIQEATEEWAFLYSQLNMA